MGIPVPNDHDSLRVPWLPTDGQASDKHIFFLCFGFFLATVLAIAHWSYTKHAVDVPDDQLYRWHFLGGKCYSAALGTLTLFSTIFSAVTIAGVPYEASLTGFQSARWLTSSIWIGIGAMLCIPRFYRLMGIREYDCPNDFVSDRFNNRLLSVMTSLISACSVCLYIIIQFYAISDLLPALSRGVDGQAILDRNVTTWVLAVIIIVCEWLGGFDAVTWTDCLQSIVLIFAFIAVPVTYAYYYGDLAGAGDSFGYDCDNFFVLNCTQQAFIDFGSPCASSTSAAAYSTGCLSYTVTNFLDLYPAGAEESKYFEPVTKIAESGCDYNYNQSLPTCTPTVFLQLGWFLAVPPAQWVAAKSTFPVPGPYSEERAWADIQDNSPLPTYTGADSRGAYTRIATNMFSFNLLFFSLSLFPHWVMKAMSIKSDKEVKFAYTVLSFSALWSVFPMMLVGIAGSALLKGIYPDAGTEFFAIIIDDLANRGGGAEYIAALGGVGAIAAMMSTVDSSLISVTNLISTDFLRNWLMPNANDRTLLHVCKGISLVVLVGCVGVALYDQKLNNDPNVYATLIAWQSSLLWQILPAFMLAQYWSMNAWACMIGQVCGIATIVGLYVNADGCHNWNTAYAWKKDSYLYNNVLSADNHPEECDINTYFIDYHVWAAAVNVFVSVLMSVLFGLVDLGNTVEALRMEHVEKRYAVDGAMGELDLEKINEIMDEEGTREPIRDPIAVVCLLACMALTTFSLPWWGTTYNDCDQQSYTRWMLCETLDVDCQAMCDRADMSLAPPAPTATALVTAAACLSNSSITCSCPLQGGYFFFPTAATQIPTDPIANVSWSASVASLSTGGGIVYDGTGNGKVCEGGDFINGIPRWAMIVIACWAASMFVLAVAWSRWACVDDASQKQARGSSMATVLVNSVVVHTTGGIEGSFGMGTPEQPRRKSKPTAVTQL